MPLFGLLKHQAGDKLPGLLMLLLVAGGANALVLQAVNAAAMAPKAMQGDVSLFARLCLALALYTFTHYRLMIEAPRRIEAIIIDWRERLLTRLCQIDVLEFQALDRAEIFAAVSSEMRLISYGSTGIAEVAQSSVLTLVTLVYIYTLSPTAALIVALFLAVGITTVLRHRTRAEDALGEAYRLEKVLVDHVADIIGGFKEMKMDSARADDMSRRFMAISRQIKGKKEAAVLIYARYFIESQNTFYFLIVALVFVAPKYIPELYANLVVITTSTLFLISPVFNIVSNMPDVINANTAAKSIQSFESQLPKPNLSPDDAATDTRSFPNFRTLGLKSAVFIHHDRATGAAFQVGPIDITVERGQQVFITGGNGSGKTTALHMLLGLYPLEQGRLLLDDTPIDDANALAQYRRLFSVVFADNHLFEELYGIDQVDAAMAKDLFGLMEIDHKAGLTGRRFNSVRLSGGQRKRLALIAGLLENKPICVLDEWAAAQEPYFREKFYRVVLPRLKAMGITVIVISHDRQYHHLADVHLHMEGGRVVAPLAAEA